LTGSNWRDEVLGRIANGTERSYWGSTRAVKILTERSAAICPDFAIKEENQQNNVAEFR
jgi:hypothetical protein